MFEKHSGEYFRDLLGAQCSFNVDLSKLSRWKIGGTADCVVEPLNMRQFTQVIKRCSETEMPFVVIGDATNLLFDDDGYRGVVIRIGRSFAKYRLDGNSLYAEAGIWVPKLARIAGTAGLAGLEHTIGIPGTFGGLVVMNGGSLRRSIGECVESVTCLDLEGKKHVIRNSDCGFGYRQSRFQDSNFIVLGARLNLEPEKSAIIRTQMLEILKNRRRKFPQKLPNCGSVFKSSSTMYLHHGTPGEIIEGLGLKGTKIGGARVSDLHANFIVNDGNATSSDVLQLIQLIVSRIHQELGQTLQTEVRYVPKSGNILPVSSYIQQK